MSGAEMQHVGEALREIERVLAQKSLRESVRSDLRMAKDSLQRALDWGEDELGGGSTDD